MSLRGGREFSDEWKPLFLQQEVEQQLYLQPGSVHTGGQFAASSVGHHQRLVGVDLRDRSTNQPINQSINQSISGCSYISWQHISAGRYTSSHWILVYIFIMIWISNIPPYCCIWLHNVQNAAPCDTVSDRTLFSVALLNRHGATARRVRVNSSALVLRYGEGGLDRHGSSSLHLLDLLPVSCVAPLHASFNSRGLTSVCVWLRRWEYGPRVHN